jgi:hypothetical protein
LGGEGRGGEEDEQDEVVWATHPGRG